MMGLETGNIQASHVDKLVAAKASSLRAVEELVRDFVVIFIVVV